MVMVVCVCMCVRHVWMFDVFSLLKALSVCDAIRQRLGLFHPAGQIVGQLISELYFLTKRQFFATLGYLNNAHHSEGDDEASIIAYGLNKMTQFDLEREGTL